MNYINDLYSDLPKTAKKYKQQYADAQPFPSIYFENFFNETFLNEILNEFPDLQKEKAKKFHNDKEIKLAGRGERQFRDKTKAFMHYLNSEPFLEFLQDLTGIEETLIGDPYFAGGGLHEIKRGGLLKVHADFNKHPKIGLDRRINVLVYLNKNWKDEYGGHFELWDRNMTRCVNKVPATFNTMAIFSTTDFSYHGHPDPLQCPEGMSRKSLALYYYSNGRPQEELSQEKHTTLFKARQGNQDDEKAFSEKKGILKKIFN